MSRPPRKPRPITRAADLPEDTVSGRTLIRHSDPRQAELFVPGFIPPMKPTLAERVPVGPLWQYELKLDGYRIQAHAQAGTVRLYTKGGHDWTDRMPQIASDVAALDVTSIVLDGEVIMGSPEGLPDFFALHAALAKGRAPEAVLFAFDLLELDGVDLRPRSLAERRALLAETLARAPESGVLLSENLEGHGPDLLRGLCAAGYEGIVAKRKDSAYRSGRSDCWIKVKCTLQEHFAVIGFDPAGRSGVASLRLAKLEGDTLVPCGFVGSGIGGEASAGLRQALDAGRPIVAEVEHGGHTPRGELRHPVFKGWGAE